MDKIEFKIPMHKPKENVTEPKENVTGYTEITTNVYAFNTISSSDDNIYITYNSACKYKKNGNHTNALKLFKQCEEKITNETQREIIYEIYVNIALMYTETNGSFHNISVYYKKAMEKFPDRAEPYFYLSLYCNKHKYIDNVYELLTKALNISYDDAKRNYKMVQRTAYGKFLYDELSVTCYLLKNFEEAKCYVEIIIDDPDFLHCKERLNKNLEFINMELKTNIVK